MLDTYIEESSHARLARLLMEHKENQRCGENETPLEAAQGIPEVDAELVATASDNFLPENGKKDPVVCPPRVDRCTVEAPK